MTTRTRYFVIVSLLILTVGVGTGLVAYYAGIPLLQGHEGPDELRYLPRDAAVVASANVQEIMHSEVRQRLLKALPETPDGQRNFQSQTGINIETDIDRIVACLEPRAAGAEPPVAGPGGGAAGGPEGLVLARGRFDAVKIEGLMREHGAQVEEYKGARLISAQPSQAPPPRDAPANFALTFIEPGLAAFGSARLVRSAVDLKSAGENVTANQELMDRVRSMSNDNAWAIGRFDALGPGALPPQVAGQLPAITWFSISGHVDRDIRGVISADTRDEEAANNFRDVLKGFMALAKMQAGRKPEFQAVMQSLQLGGTGKTVQLSFSVPGEILDAVGALRGNRPAAPTSTEPAH